MVKPGCAICFGIIALAAGVGTLRSDPVIEWNRQMLGSIRTDTSAPTLASRNLAILHAAIYDAVNSIERTHQPYRFLIEPGQDSSTEAAVVGAGYSVMVTLYPQFRARFDEAYQQFLASSADSVARSNGLQLGRLVGLLAVDSRSADSSNTQVTYIPSDAPGQWRRTPPFFRPPLDPQWRYVDPFCLPDIDPFVPPGPPRLDSAAYADDMNQVRALGAKTNSVRTAEQSQIAVFWSDFSYTETPAGHWQEIVGAVSLNQSNTVSDNARLFALVSMGQADAGIVTWEAKYRYNFWRPVTAIQRADEDNNPATDKDAAWESFLVSPPFPEYTSGHSTFSKASAVVISNFYGTDALSFTVGADALPGVTRSFDSLAACADEIGLSRIYGGIHFMSANRDGKACGAKIGEFVSRNFLLPNDGLPILLIESFSDSSLKLRLHGHIGSRCVLQTSNDLTIWNSMSTNLAVVGGVVVEAQSLVSAAIRFYRLREE